MQFITAIFYIPKKKGTIKIYFSRSAIQDNLLKNANMKMPSLPTLS